MTGLRGFVVVLIVAGSLACGAGSGDDYAARMAKEHADDAPVSNPISETAPVRSVVEEEVVYATVDGRDVTGFLARPEGAGATPGILVIHEWWGLNDNIRAMARRLAGEGYTALAVDLYGDVAEDRERARQLMMATNASPAGAEDNLRQAYAYLSERLAAPAVASIGWCFGGGWSLNTALMLPDSLDATVIYYGQLVTEPERLEPLSMPILGLFGEQDQGIPIDSVRAFEASLDSLDKDARIVVYPGANHAFANPSGRNYQQEAAEASWQETVSFLARTIGSGSDSGLRIED